MIGKSAVIALAFTLTGCGLIPRTGEPSRALQFADNLNLPAWDESREEFEANAKASGTDPNGYRNGQMVMSALTLDPTMILLSGFTPASASSHYQIAAWVPSDLAPSGGEEAVAVAEKTVAQAWAEISDKSPEEKAAMASRKLQYILDEPYGENGLTGSLTQLADMMVGVHPEKEQAPAFMQRSGEVYGPLVLGFGCLNSINQLEELERLSTALPDWFYIYNPGAKNILPKSVLNQGKHLYFVAPNS